MKVQEFIKGVSIADDDKLLISSALSIIGREDFDPRLVPRTFLFHGDPGVGKSHVASAISKVLDCETVFYGITTPKEGVAVCKDFGEVKERTDNPKKQLIILDDLNLLLDKLDMEPTVESVRGLHMLFNIVSKSKNKILIATINEISDLGQRTMDRFEAKVKFSPPSSEQKLSYISMVYPDVIGRSEAARIANDSFGYSFRDIPSLLTRAYALGNGKFTASSVKRALETYQPSSFAEFKVVRGIKIRIDDMVGLREQKEMLKSLVTKQKTKRKAADFESKVLIFSGPPGTGKTLSARALCGELKWPLITMTMRRNPFYEIQGILNMAKRNRNCIILIDEAEKIFGGPMAFDDVEGGSSAVINSILDGADKEPIMAMIIFAVNNPYRFGSSLRNRCRMIKFDLPEYQDRKEFFRKCQKTASAKIDEKQANDFAQKSEGMNYREMQRLWEDMTVFGKHYKTYEKYGEGGPSRFEDTGMMFG